mmetsp:Transcript_61915/g.119349  ORF Transcript_61915/g.119349 Transcript_61915/m.119349 type:complete len:135 (-) Transcript_61915:3-407(-)
MSPEMRAIACVAMLVTASEANSQFSLRRTVPVPADANACKVTCQRFGFQALGKWKPEFKDMTNPTVCCTKCDEAFSGEAKIQTQQMMQAEVAPAMTAQQCKTICHRFGMKTLGPKFSSITNPVECAKQCDVEHA